MLPVESDLQIIYLKTFFPRQVRAPYAKWICPHFIDLYRALSFSSFRVLFAAIFLARNSLDSFPRRLPKANLETTYAFTSTYTPVSSFVLSRSSRPSSRISLDRMTLLDKQNFTPSLKIAWRYNEFAPRILGIGTGRPSRPPKCLDSLVHLSSFHLLPDDQEPDHNKQRMSLTYCFEVLYTTVTMLFSASSLVLPSIILGNHTSIWACAFWSLLSVTWHSKRNLSSPTAICWSIDHIDHTTVNIDFTY